MEEATDLLNFILEHSKKIGANETSALLSGGNGITVSVLNSELENIEHHQNRSISISLSLGKSVGNASTSDFSKEALINTIQAAYDIAKYTADDPFSGLPEKDLLATEFPDLALCRPWSKSIDETIEMVKLTESSGLASDKNLHSMGAEFHAMSSYFMLANSLGFMAGFPTSSVSLSASFMASRGDEKQSGSWYSSERYPENLSSPELVGKTAADKSMSLLGAKRIATGHYPVLFENRVAMSLWSSFLGAFTGSAQYRKTSFLLDSLHTQVLPEHIQIFEDPFIKGGFSSTAFDDEGVATQARQVIKNGVLQNYFLSSYSARKLGMQTTGHAGGSHNLFIRSDRSQNDFDGLVKKMNKGLIVTSLMGQGFNPVTGDYSRGASGFWVEHGEIQFPVQEITIAGNIKEMMMNIVAMGTDEVRVGSRSSGSILIENMMIAGV
ncbi:hypothetical protein IX83_06290 [Basilea psittacipulmonis DSM 24701]|uniref:Peptidase PmbA n=1 Tax=Basilea psittacipulmonis DSM 24701 TaxID=1072685 RepID=A0A077DE65_9BURK|nr:hypothetical protein IX83_06290 [Basilea psittacipulmonis DSM 24701]